MENYTVLITFHKSDGPGRVMQKTHDMSFMIYTKLFFIYYKVMSPSLLNMKTGSYSLVTEKESSSDKPKIQFNLTQIVYVI